MKGGKREGVGVWGRVGEEGGREAGEKGDRGIDAHSNAELFWR